MLWSLERDVCPAFGAAPVAAIRPLEVRALLQKVEARGSIETAHRLRQRIAAVFVWAISCGLCEGNPAAHLGATLKPVPPRHHQPAIVDQAVDEAARLAALRSLLAACEALPTRAENRLALRLLALTAVRPGELAGARWEEFFDLDGAQPTWVIPAARMKGVRSRREDPKFGHPVPLARRAVEILVTLHRLTGRHALRFPLERHVHRQISENTLRAILIRAGYNQRRVPHGFRAAFSTIMNERAITQERPGDRAVIDLMLAHTPSGSGGAARGSGRAPVSAAEAACNRATYMPRRRALAQEWADLLLQGFPPADALVGGPIRGSFSATFVQRDIADPNQPAFRPVGVPDISGFVWASWQPVPMLTILPSLDFAGDHWIVNTAGTTWRQDGAHALANIRIAWEPMANLELAASGRNLFDSNCQLAEGFPAEGRSFMLSIRVRR